MQALGQVWGRVDPRAPDLRETATSLAAPKLYGAQLLLDQWRKAENGFAVGREIPSRVLSSILRNIAVFEPIDGDYRVRVGGTALLQRFGRDITGARMSELYAPATFARRCKWLRDAMDGNRPVIHHIEMRQGNRRPLSFELVFLPLLAPDLCSKWALAGFFYYED
jgi:hypothetical protein